MLIDCDRCEMREIACSDCVVATLLGLAVDERDQDGAGETAATPRRDHRVLLDEPARRALRTLADAGVVPPLRYELPAASAS